MISPRSPARHREVLIALSRDDDGIAVAFEEQEGLALAAAFDDLLAEQKAERADGHAAGLSRGVPDRVRRSRGAAAGDSPARTLHIYGPLESRLMQADRVIVGGLIEGVWPPAPRIDPWLSRPMRHELGLDLPERRIGLSAHDFAQLLGTEDVILSHSAKAGGAPAVASRFLHRLEAVAGEERWEAARQAGERYVHFALGARRARRGQADCAARADAAARDAAAADCRSPRSRTGCAIPTRSTPSISSSCERARSRRHAAVGGRSRLGDPRCARRIHQDLCRQICPPIPSRVLREIGEKHFAPLMERPEARALWWPRFQRIVRWFSEWETARRGDIAAIEAEIKGEIPIQLDNERTFHLSARADRIERRADGTLRHPRLQDRAAADRQSRCGWDCRRS